MNNINEETNAKFSNVTINKLGYDSTRVGKSISDFESRFKYGSNHINNEQLKEASDKSQEGFLKIFPEKPLYSIKKKIPNIKMNNLSYKKMSEAVSKDANKLGYGQIAGFRKPEKEIVKELVVLDKTMDSDKAGADLQLAGKNEIKFLEEIKSHEKKVDIPITDVQPTDKEEIKEDITTIVNF